MGAGSLLLSAVGRKPAPVAQSPAPKPAAGRASARHRAAVGGASLSGRAPRLVCPSGDHRRSLVRREILRHGAVVELTQAEAADMEVGIYNSIISFATANNVVKSWSSAQFVALYASKARSVLANLEPGDGGYIGNARLLTRLREGEFCPHEIADMRPENVFPERWKAALDARLRQDEYLNAKPAAMTDLFKCSKCHKRECVYHELQLRSGDEPMSIFITCLNCGLRWRQG